MALTDENSGNGMIMPVQPMGGYGYGGNTGGGFGFGGDWAWILLLLVLGGGWGGFGGFGGGWGMMNGMWGMDGAFPWLLASNANNQNATNAGFDNLAVGNSLNGIQNAVTSGFGDVQLGIAGINQNICQSTGQIQNSLCQGFAGTTAAITGAQNALAQQLYSNEIANLNRSFAEQTANTAAINGVSSQLAQCCCDNRLAAANLQSVIQAENCADRAAVSDGIRDILTATQAQNQRILDKLCDQELQAERRENDQLRTQLNMANLAASQAAQTAAIAADNAAQTQYIVNRVAPYPTPSYNVPNPYTGCCNQYGCGCNG